jgi:SAM-dependent methyltransferase
VSDWWQTFFDGPYAEVYPTVFSDEETHVHVDRAERLLGLERPTRILDVPCGYGRTALELAARGHDVVGLDLSDAMLTAAGRGADERGVQLDLVRGDMREPRWQGEFEAAVSLFGSLGYADDASDLRFFEAVHRALVPGGSFLIEGYVAETYLIRFRPRSWSQHGDMVMLEESRYDPATARIVSDWTFIRNGTTETQSSSIRLYTFRELMGLFDRAGFVEVEAFDWETLRPYEFGAIRFAVLARKR